MEAKKKCATAEKSNPNSNVVLQHHEEHKEEAEWQEKGADEKGTSWSKVMKVTKRIEKTSKTEERTKTYKVGTLLFPASMQKKSTAARLISMFINRYPPTIDYFATFSCSGKRQNNPLYNLMILSFYKIAAKKRGQINMEIMSG